MNEPCNFVYQKKVQLAPDGEAYFVLRLRCLAHDAVIHEERCSPHADGMEFTRIHADKLKAHEKEKHE